MHVRRESHDAWAMTAGLGSNRANSPDWIEGISVEIEQNQVGMMLAQCRKYGVTAPEEDDHLAGHAGD